MSFHSLRRGIFIRKTVVNQTVFATVRHLFSFYYTYPLLSSIIYIHLIQKRTHFASFRQGRVSTESARSISCRRCCPFSCPRLRARKNRQDYGASLRGRFGSPCPSICYTHIPRLSYRRSSVYARASR